MSVWPSFESTSPALSGSEGKLHSVSVAVEPQYLEELLDALARLPFPINPQIYHDAATVYSYPDGRRETEPATLVEFPAYESWLPNIRSSLQACGFPADAVSVSAMLEYLHSDTEIEAPPPGAAYCSRTRVKHANSAA